MKKLVIIPARAGSKRLPNKNLKLLDGKPLIMHSVEIARKIFDDNEICVSTDSFKIKEIVEESGLDVPFLRPKNLAKDSSSMEDVLLHSLRYYNKIGYDTDVIILLQPTSPFRREKDIKNAIKKFSIKNDMVVSVNESKVNPYYTLYEESKFGFLKQSKKGKYQRSQDAPRVWELNGSIYIINVIALKKKGLSNFNKIIKYNIDNPICCLDIDTEFDWLIADTIINKKLKYN